ncbi:unnamed protein product [Rhizoctonia solani]|uniref:Eukaryotic translation initiation factor 4G1 eIF4E-binding domain-containing protein n=1 Tax=Rhizoctonia solani TaxID=456999 RepID=A0A8H2XTN1_9AGAM|nr:unnamed protein product [Rhizoctonia solani]
MSGATANTINLKEIYEAELKLWPKKIKNIEDFTTVKYPTDINPPDLKFNCLVQPGRFRVRYLGISRYHRNFLLQFTNICTKKPVSLVPLDIFGLEPSTDWRIIRLAHREGRRGDSRSADGVPPQRSSLVELGRDPGLHRPGFFTGSMQSPLKPGDDRFISRTPSVARPDEIPSAGATQGKDTRKFQSTHSQHMQHRCDSMGAKEFRAPSDHTNPLECITPLVLTPRRCGFESNLQNTRQQTGDRQLVGRKLKALLNRLTVQNFDSISDQIIDWEVALESFQPCLDTPKAKNYMDIYFERMQDLAKSSNISFRMQFALLDIIELRARYWQPRHTASSVLTYQDYLGIKLQKHSAMPGGLKRGRPHGDVTEPDGWNVAGWTGSSRPPARAGDLSQFGKISKPAGIQFGPSSVFSKRDA